MLREWLGGAPVAGFLETYLGKAPFASPGSAAGAVALLDWARLGRMLEGAAALDALMVARGRTVEAPVPRDLAGLRARFARGVGLVVRRAERSDAALARLAEAFARDLPGAVTLQVFATPGGTHGFGWHYDFEHVFIAQTAGAKTYYFRPNTVDPHARLGTQPDFSRVKDERSPMAAARLVAGDWLYLPARWWHVAQCEQDALSVSVGVLPRAPGRRLHRAVAP